MSFWRSGEWGGGVGARAVETLFRAVLLWRMESGDRATFWIGAQPYMLCRRVVI